MNMKYNLFVQLLINNYSQVVRTGIIKEQTLNEYIQGTRKARPVSIILISKILGQNYNLYV